MNDAKEPHRGRLSRGFSSDRERLGQHGQGAGHHADGDADHRQRAQRGKRILSEIIAVGRAEEKVRISMTIRTEVTGACILCCIGRGRARCGELGCLFGSYELGVMVSIFIYIGL